MLILKVLIRILMIPIPMKPSTKRKRQLIQQRLQQQRLQHQQRLQPQKLQPANAPPQRLPLKRQLQRKIKEKSSIHHLPVMENGVMKSNSTSYLLLYIHLPCTIYCHLSLSYTAFLFQYTFKNLHVDHHFRPYLRVQNWLQ